MTRRGAALALVLACAAGGARAQEAKPADPAERLGLKFSRTEELVITADEAEGAKEPSGRESVVFTKHVKARQADLSLECDWLKAVYPETTAGHPEKIYAKGSVVITQGGNQARCVEADIDNVACTAECRSSGGKALLRRGTDDVEADTIYFDLCKGTVKAVGGVSVRVREKPNDTKSPAKPETPDAPQGTKG